MYLISGAVDSIVDATAGKLSPWVECHRVHPTYEIPDLLPRDNTGG